MTALDLNGTDIKVGDMIAVAQQECEMLVGTVESILTHRKDGGRYVTWDRFLQQRIDSVAIKVKPLQRGGRYGTQSGGRTVTLEYPNRMIVLSRDPSRMQAKVDNVSEELRAIEEALR